MEKKIACVTGASRGIGAEICVKLANKGFDVVGLARSVNKIEDLNKRVDPSTGKIVGIKCDIESETEIQDAFKWIKDKFGRFDIFINNAGIMKTDFLIDETTQNFRKMFDVNVIATCVCLREAVKLFSGTAGKGQIVILNSILGHRVPDIPFSIKPFFGVYPATKFAISALCQTIRQELSYLKLPIRVTSISPGMVDSEMLNNMSQEIVSIFPKLNIEDVANAVLYAVNTPDSVQVDDIRISAM